MASSHTTPPAPLSPIPFNIPRAKETALENGLRVVVFEDSRLPLVSFRLAFASGDIDDPADFTGLTSAVAAMLTEGTENYTSLAIAEKIERLGGSLSSSSSDDFTAVSASCLSLYSAEVLNLIAEVTLRPTFPESELDLYKRNSIENLKFQRSQPNFLANEQVSRLIFGDHPYSIESPAAEDIEKLSSSLLAKFHSQRFIPNNAFLLVVGDVDQDEILNEIQEAFGKWQPGEAPERQFPEIPSRTAATLTLVDRPGSAQANIVIAGPSVDRSHPDFFPLLVMNQVLGAGASSRVFMNLREEKGYTYGAYTRFDTKKFAGCFEATAEVRTEVTGDSLREFYYELDRIRDEKVADVELADAKNFLTGVFPLRAETQEGLTGLLAARELYGLPEDYLQTYRDNVSAVSADDVKRVANEHIQPDKMAIVIVGDAGQILPQARDRAETVEIFDMDKNEIDPAVYENEGSDVKDVGGVWKLDLDFMGQQVPVTLSIDQEGSSISGVLETPLGSGNIASGSVRGENVNATANMKVQGQDVEFIITATVEDDVLNGNISGAMLPDQLKFSGKRG